MARFTDGCLAAFALAASMAGPTLAMQSIAKPEASSTPAWVQRGAKGAAHAAIAPLVGLWNVELSVYGTMGRSPDEPPIVSRDLRATRTWIANGHYLEETIEGTLAGQAYWRRGWLGFSNMDRHYEWVTAAPLVPLMLFRGASGSGQKMPIDLIGSFTDQGVVNETTVGKSVGMRTLIKIETPDRHVTELYFTPPGAKEQLAMRILFTRK